jgi:hypothetical protein
MGLLRAGQWAYVPRRVGIGLASGWTYAPDARDICPAPLGRGAGAKTIVRLVISGERLKSYRSIGSATRSGQTMLVHRQSLLAGGRIKIGVS